MSLIDTLRQAGFKGDGLRQAWAIANRESGGRPDAFNGNTGTGDRSWGLFQVNTLGPLQARVKQYGLKSERDLLDPNTNASVAYRMSKGGTDFGAWGVGPNAYRKTPPLDFTGFPGGQQSRRPGGDDPLGPAEPSRPGPWDPLAGGTSSPKQQLALSLLASRRGRDQGSDRRSMLLSMLTNQAQEAAPDRGYGGPYRPGTGAQSTTPPPAGGTGTRPTVAGELVVTSRGWKGTHVTDGLDMNHGAKTAGDIMANPGSPVGAPEDGTVERWGSAQGGEAMYFRGKSGRLYWLGHIDDRIPVGTVVRANQPLARISSDHPNPHLHVDASSR